MRQWANGGRFQNSLYLPSFLSSPPPSPLLQLQLPSFEENKKGMYGRTAQLADTSCTKVPRYAHYLVKVELKVWAAGGQRARAVRVH